MRPGRLNKRLIIERQDDTVDSWGDPQVTQTVVAVVYAQIDGVTGEEFWGAQQVESKVTHRIWIRYSSELRPMSTMTSKWRGRLSNHDSPETFRVFDFVMVRNVRERDRMIEVLAEEYPNA